MIRQTYFKIRHRFSRLSLKIVVRWIRFSKKHQDSHRLPVVLFLFLTLDGFVSVIPAGLLVIASVTISPHRWKVFGWIFAIASTTNNVAAYFVGRWLSPDTIVSTIEKFHLESFWHAAERALHDYGSYAAFIGAIVGLPTQLVMILIGIADTQLLNAYPEVGSSFIKAILFSFAAHSIKGLGLAGLARFGWIKLKKRVESSTAIEERISPV